MSQADTEAPPAGFSYTEDQSEAIEKIRRWYFSESTKQFTLAGLAGTGKTTISATLSTAIGVKIDYVAPTGKAAQVLRMKGMEAETIHSFIYDFGGKTKHHDERTGETREVLHFNNSEDGSKGESPLVVADEASMINESLYFDLMSQTKDARVLFVGDHGQLPPVGRDPGIMRRPDVTLERVMRQAEGNPIVAFAHRVRSEAALRMNLDLADGERLRIVGRSSTEKLCKYALDSGIDQIIVPFHKVRKAVNWNMRALLGMPGELAKGDRVVARLNNRRQHIYNGNQFEIVSDVTPAVGYSSEEGDRKFIASLRSVDDGRVWEDLSLYLPGKTGSWNDECYKGSNVAIDFAYAITCHSAQGSEWDRVLAVYSPFRGWSNERWLYTAVTRASKHLTVVAG
jgi:exodeoxyribonuclease V